MFLMNVGAMMDAEALETCFYQNSDLRFLCRRNLAGVWERRLAEQYRESVKTKVYFRAKVGGRIVARNSRYDVVFRMEH